MGFAGSAKVAAPIEDAKEHASHDYGGFDGVSISEYASIDGVTRLAAFITEHSTRVPDLLDQFS